MSKTLREPGPETGDDFPPVTEEPSGRSYDEVATHKLFAEIASHQARPIKSFIAELREGNPSKDWLEICQPVLGMLIDGAESLELESLARRMVNFREALWLARTREGSRVDGEGREQILLRYEDLVEILPETFDIGKDERRGESILIHSLLRQVPEVGRVTFEKLYGAGLTALDALLVATPEQLQTATGISAPLCGRICERLESHRERLAARRDYRDRLAELVNELRRQVEATEQAIDRRGSKVEALRSRQACALEIDVVLAEMGQVDLLQQLHKVAFTRRLARLEEFLDSAIAFTNGQDSPTRPSPSQG